MITLKSGESAPLSGTLFFSMYLCLFALSAPDLAQTATVKNAVNQDIKAFFKGTRKTVLTFVGYSGAGYEDDALLRKHAEVILGEFDPAKTIVNIGATPEGIGAIYEMAKRKGFMTTGIVSSQARRHNVKLSPFVDHVFYVEDATWGRFVAATKELSPTSKAMVENSDIIVGIGGGEVARDEIISAKQLGKKVRFVPADMNHQKARQRAKEEAAGAVRFSRRRERSVLSLRRECGRANCRRDRRPTRGPTSAAAIRTTLRFEPNRTESIVRVARRDSECRPNAVRHRHSLSRYHAGAPD